MKVVLDLDDVLCDFVGTWNQWLFDQGYTEKVLGRYDVPTYDFFQKFGREVNDFYLKDPHHTYRDLINPFDGSVEFVNWCKEQFDDVSVLSHATSDKSRSAKTEFVNTHFGIEARFSNSKNEKYNFTDGAVLIDDYPMNVLKHIVHNKKCGICFNINYENGWSTIMNHVDILQQHNPDMTKYWIASDYELTKTILLRLRGNE